MRADQKSIGKLLQGQNQFLVPVFQREYVWKKGSVQRLWADIVAVSHEGAGRHFLGAFVLASTPFATGFDKWLVVDGQQRLTTLSILFCALRDHVRPTDLAFARKIDDLYLLNPHEEGEDRLKLVLGSEDQASWSALVKGAPNAGGENTIGEAYRVFRQELVRQDDDEPIEIARIERAIAYQCDIVEVTVDKNDNLHRIFESLNYGGERLLQADLLRNYVFMRLPTRWRGVYDQHWQPMQALLTPGQIEELIRTNLVLLGHERVAKDTVYQTQQARMQSLADEDAVEAWAAEIHRQARVFKRIVSPGEEKDPLVRDALGRLGQWERTVTSPITLTILSRYDEGKLTAAETAEALRRIESFIVRRYLVRSPTSDSDGRIIARLVRSLGTEVPTAAVLARNLSQPQWEFPTDDQVREAVMENNFYNRNAARRNYILRRLEEGYEHRERIDLDAAELTVEHILPRNLSDEWRDLLARDAIDQESVDAIHSALVHTLGNLTLTAYNGDLGNDGFASKRVILANSGLAMNRDLATFASWGKREILARSAALAERIITIWPGPVTTGRAAGAGPRRAPAPAPAVAVTTVATTVATKPKGTSAAEQKWRQLPQILAVIPAGRWTSFADVALVIGGQPATVGQKLIDGTFANAHRVLKLRNPVPPEAQRPQLEAEGVRFDRHGKAAADQRIRAEDLAVAIGLDVSA